MRYCLIQDKAHLSLVEIPATHMYQFTALIYRLHKELEKLTVEELPFIPTVLLECSEVDITSTEIKKISGLPYINQLEKQFALLKDANYPVISLLTEIRAFQAQLEFLEEDFD